ncbi:molybdopterin-binding protein [soil metagenome]
MTGGTLRPIRETIPIGQALALVLEAATPITRTERVPLDEAHGRVLAESVLAAADVPPFERGAMDGFAVRADDTSGATRDVARTLRCVGSIFTGMVPSIAVARGECVAIATGAPMPDGADAVVMVEDTDRIGDEVRVFAPVHPRQNVGRQGADLAAGDTVLQAGSVITPGRLGALAAAGIAEPLVFARPAVAILSTGDEIVEPGRPLGPGQIYDVNGHTLSAIVRMHGGVPIPLPRAPDAMEDLMRAVAEAAESADLIVFSGGSSVGERDLILDVMRAAGEVIFHGISVKPGKPTALGRIHSRPALGMPGNPTSCLSNGYLLLAPMLRRMARLPEHRPHVLRLPLARRILSTTGRHQFYTVQVADGSAVPVFKSSGDITSMSQADGYIEIPAQTASVEAGEMVEVVLF